MAAFAADPDALMAAGQVLKAGNSATVVRSRIDGRSVVIKRYNLKHPSHRLRRMLNTRSRFRRAWREGQRLAFLGIPTARPLALLERRIGPLRGVAHLVLEDLGDAVLPQCLAAGKDVRKLAAEAARRFDELRWAGLVHGDTKATNFVLRDGRLHLLDLDALHESRRGFQHSVERFLANFDGDAQVRAAFAEALAGISSEPNGR
jgi:tRNA A-37 threonylcarbamoyl transferase component Bud32